MIYFVKKFNITLFSEIEILEDVDFTSNTSKRILNCIEIQIMFHIVLKICLEL